MNEFALTIGHDLRESLMKKGLCGGCRSVLRATLLICLLSSIAQSHAQESSLRVRRVALPVDAAISQKRFYYDDQVNLSQDGKWVVYAVQDPRKSKTTNNARYEFLTETGVSTDLISCDVWITSTDNPEHTSNLTEGRGTSWAPVWSPDGNYVAFFSDRSGQARPWIWERSSGHLRELSDVIPVSDWHMRPRWTPDSKELVVVALPRDVTIEDAITRQMGHTIQDGRRSEDESSAQVFISSAKSSSSLRDRNEGVDDSSVQPVDIVVIDVLSGTTRQLAKRVSPTADVEISPNGRDLAFFNYKRRGFEPLTRVYDLIVVDLVDAASRVLSRDVTMHGEISLSWSPDSGSLSYIAGRFVLQRGSGIVTVVPGDCFLVSVDSGLLRPVTTGPHPGFDGTRPPMWSADGHNLVFLAENNSIWAVSIATGATKQVGNVAGRTLRDIVAVAEAPGRYWSPDRQSIYVMTFDGKTKMFGFWRMNLSNGAVAKLVEGVSRYSRHYGGFWGSTDGRRIVFTAENSANPQEIWVAGLDFKNARQISHIHSSLDRYALGQPQLITWRSDDGDELHGALLLPADYEDGKRYPLVVHIYGGEDLSNYVSHFGGFESDVLNWQLLASRGYAVFQPDSVSRGGSPMLDLAKSVLPGINKVIALGVADPNLIGIFGHSYGGYGTLALIAQSPRFQAAVCYAGYGDVLSHYADMYEGGEARWIESTEQRGEAFGGSPWQYRDRYIENSPFFYLDRVQTPVLIIHGSEDHPATWIEGTFVGLRRLGKEAMYVKYDGEGHTIEGYANQVDATNRILEWFDKYLRKSVGTGAPSSPH